MYDLEPINEKYHLVLSQILASEMFPLEQKDWFYVFYFLLSQYTEEEVRENGELLKEVASDILKEQ